MVTINNKYLSCRLISIPWKTVTHWLLVDVFLLPSPPLPMFGGFLPLVFGYDSNQCHREVGHGMVYIQELDQQYLPENSDSSIGSDQFPYGRVWKYSIPSKWACNEENEWTWWETFGIKATQLPYVETNFHVAVPFHLLRCQSFKRAGDPWQWKSKDSNSEATCTVWVCLKIGCSPNYSHLIVIVIINHWVCTLCSDEPTYVPFWGLQSKCLTTACSCHIFGPSLWIDVHWLIWRISIVKRNPSFGNSICESLLTLTIWISQ